MKKTAVILLMALLFSLLFSCASDKKDGAEPTQAAAGAADDSGAAAEVFAQDDSAKWNDNLGEFDFGGYEFNFYSRDIAWANAIMDYTEITGSAYEDSVYERNRRLEERFNIKFVNTASPDSAKAKKSMQAGTNDYDVIMIRNADAIVFAGDGLISGFGGFVHIDLSKPYWDDNVNSCLTISNKRYFAAGSFNITSYDMVHVIIFNKSLIARYGLESPYGHVKNGSWTYDVFSEMTKAAVADLNGDGKMDKNDSYGFLSAPKQVLPCFWVAADLKSIEKDANDIPFLAMGSEKFMNVFDRIFEMTWDTEVWYRSKSGENIDPDHTIMFHNDQALFMDCTFFYLKDFRGMDSDFGILPFPKYTKEQEHYYSRMEGCDLFFAPMSAPAESLERTSVILEALASDSAKSVVPVYYDLALKTKFTRDEESAEILDLLFDNRVYDLGDTIWGDKLRDPIVAPMMQNNKRELASKLESIENTMKKQIDIVVEAFEKLD
jgi:hypothetical protein